MNNEYAVMQCEYALMNMYWTLRTNASWSTAMVKAKIYAGLFNFTVVGMMVFCLLCMKKESKGCFGFTVMRWLTKDQAW